MTTNFQQANTQESIEADRRMVLVLILAMAVIASMVAGAIYVGFAIR